MDFDIEFPNLEGQIHNAAKQFAFETGVLTDKARSILDCSENLRYRLSSIRFHHDYSLFILSEGNARLVEDFGKTQSKGSLHHVTLSTNQICNFLLDDLILGMGSFFDYSAKFFEITNDSITGHRLDWNGLRKGINRGDFKLKCCCKKAILKHNKKWIKNLSTYRTEVFHNKAKFTDPAEKVKFASGKLQSQIVIRIPEYFYEVFPDYPGSKEDDSSKIESALEWLLEKFMISATAVYEKCYQL